MHVSWGCPKIRQGSVLLSENLWTTCCSRRPPARSQPVASARRAPVWTCVCLAGHSRPPAGPSPHVSSVNESSEGVLASSCAVLLTPARSLPRAHPVLIPALGLRGPSAPGPCAWSSHPTLSLARGLLSRPCRDVLPANPNSSHRVHWPRLPRRGGSLADPASAAPSLCVPSVCPQPRRPRSCSLLFPGTRAVPPSRLDSKGLEGGSGPVLAVFPSVHEGRGQRGSERVHENTCDACGQRVVHLGRFFSTRNLCPQPDLLLCHFLLPKKVGLTHNLALL